MLFIIAERFSSFLPAVHYIYDYLEDTRFTGNMKCIERYARRFLVQVLNKEEGIIRLIACEGLNDYVYNEGWDIE